jgi:hypothetical protein
MTAVSHIPKFGDASYLSWQMSSSVTGDALTRTGDAHLLQKITKSLEEDYASPVGDTTSPAGDEGASPNFGICDTTPK